MNSTLKNSLLTTLALGMAFPTPVFARSWKDPKNPTMITLNDPNGFNTRFKNNPGWHPTNYTYKLFELPTQGSVDNQSLPWGDSYWPSQRAGMAYRWKQFESADFENPANILDQTLSTEQRMKLFFDVKRYPRSELLRLKASNPAEYKRTVDSLSPLEKYALFVSKPGDDNYYDSDILNEFTKSKQAQREYWEGYCHAWAPVSSHYGEPMPVTKTTADGLEITFYSGDVKALLVANYQQKTSNTFGGAIGRFLNKNKRAQVRFVGKRCDKLFQYPVVKVKHGTEMFADYGDTAGLTDEQYLKTYVPHYQAEAIRLNHRHGGPDEAASDFVQQTKANMDACENTNAGSFHIVTANQLGLMKEGFQFDKTRDVEVWNQPAFKYESEVKPLLDANGRPVNALATSAPGTANVMHVKTKLYYADDSDYGWTYSTPANLGLFKVENPSLLQMIEDFKAEYTKYSKLLMNEGDESEPLKYPLGIMDAAEYEYTLDIDASGAIIGGDWISYDRPDYMWIMKKEGFFDDFKRLGEIYQAVQYPAGQQPDFQGL